MDEKTLRILEFDKILERLASYTSFSAGQALALALHPTADAAEAARRQAETQEALQLFNAGSEATIGGARDVRRAADNAMRGFVLRAEDLLDIRSTLIAARNLQRALLRVEERYPNLAAIAHLIEEIPRLVQAIGEAIDEDRGEVLDSASDRLASIRRSIRITHSRIHERLQALINSSMSRFLQEPIITSRGGRYVVPLRAEFKGQIRGIVHDQSGSGATLWIEPMNTVELNNEYRSLQIEEEEEIQRILAELSVQVAERGDAIKRIVDRLAELDLIFARARYAAAIDAIPPEFVPWRVTSTSRHQKQAEQPASRHPGSTLWIRGARHPLLPPETVVPTDLLLDEDIFLVLITGPNTGGKTVSLKTVGLMVLMAQSGLHLPAVGARLTVFDNVFADIGDEQSIEQSLSTFSAHITNITRILEQVDDRSLVLLDELGSGTDPAEGAALAQAIVNFLRDRGATTFVATHYPELKVYASQTPGATNASLLFDLETLSPTYEMTIGLPGKSNAVAIARRLGLDETILDDALRLLGAGSAHASTLLDSIYDIRDRISSQEAATRMALQKAERERDELQERLNEIDAERDEILAEARRQGQAELEALREEIQRIRKQLRSGRGDGELSGTILKQLGREVDQAEAALHAEVPEPPSQRRSVRRLRETLQAGDRVLVRSLNKSGEVISVGNKDAEVALGRLKTRVSLADLKLLEEAGSGDEDAVQPAVRTRAAPAPPMELDLRGTTVEEGLARLESYMDAAILSELPYVRIIHGKGTGRLREAVRDSLRRDTRIRSWEEGKDSEGGAGVTVVKLTLD
ncbi:MAG: endonuclease MutS2 [Chloroflexi bacterium]|nr:endonuclease MutS2 [Chloroflexota bacterium]